MAYALSSSWRVRCRTPRQPTALRHFPLIQRASQKGHRCYYRCRVQRPRNLPSRPRTRLGYDAPRPQGCRRGCRVGGGTRWSRGSSDRRNTRRRRQRTGNHPRPNGPRRAAGPKGRRRASWELAAYRLHPLFHPGTMSHVRRGRIRCPYIPPRLRRDGPKSRVRRYTLRSPSRSSTKPHLPDRKGLARDRSCRTAPYLLQKTPRKAPKVGAIGTGKVL